MAKVKVQTSLERANKTITYAIGNVTFDENGVAEVSKEHAEYLTTVHKKNHRIFEEKGSNNAGDEKKKKELETLKVADLKDIASAIEGVNKEEVDKMVKAELVEFILSKVTE